jgi:hypothetical protein
MQIKETVTKADPDSDPDENTIADAEFTFDKSAPDF